MWWPSKIQAGSISHQPAHIVDLFPNILEAVGIEYSEEINGYKPQKLQGSSLMPVLLGREREDPEFIISGWTERFRMYREDGMYWVEIREEQMEAMKISIENDKWVGNVVELMDNASVHGERSLAEKGLIT